MNLKWLEDYATRLNSGLKKANPEDKGKLILDCLKLVADQTYADMEDACKVRRAQFGDDQ